jgi:hypothetical protein
MAMKMKRGSTESWNIGPEMVHFEDWPLDGEEILYAKGTKLKI